MKNQTHLLQLPEIEPWPEPFRRYIPKSELDALRAEAEPAVPPTSAKPVAA